MSLLLLYRPRPARIGAGGDDAFIHWIGGSKKKKKRAEWKDLLVAKIRAGEPVEIPAEISKQLGADWDLEELLLWLMFDD